MPHSQADEADMADPGRGCRRWHCYAAIFSAMSETLVGCLHTMEGVLKTCMLKTVSCLQYNGAEIHGGVPGIPGRQAHPLRYRVRRAQGEAEEEEQQGRLTGVMLPPALPELWRWWV